MLDGFGGSLKRFAPGSLAAAGSATTMQLQVKTNRDWPLLLDPELNWLTRISRHEECLVLRLHDLTRNSGWSGGRGLFEVMGRAMAAGQASCVPAAQRIRCRMTAFAIGLKSDADSGVPSFPAGICLTSV